LLVIIVRAPLWCPRCLVRRVRDARPALHLQRCALLEPIRIKLRNPLARLVWLRTIARALALCRRSFVRLVFIVRLERYPLLNTNALLARTQTGLVYR
jgi:hypothetical protein